MNNICKVCGLKYSDFYPWGEDGDIPSHAICYCCGTEFGYEDNSIESSKANREKWIGDGAKWFSPDKKPQNWSLEEQLKNLPEEYK